ncbi:conserved hypothetical protein [Aeropyrum pernix]|uniref:Leucine-binding protein domain-containing protein n=1 Tax=Aeropyrum pernix TaxID=56636 RepID=A0A401H813_AERPX|nr:ABC transporter substrate-binding protein [Aeropyrum pernix]GBF08520.1 conserved hypothetical protein [Aeropyrum pernix]
MAAPARLPVSRTLALVAGAAALLVLGAAALLIAGLGGGEPEELVIGGVFSLSSGTSVETCRQALAGAMAAVEWVNSNGGVNIGGSKVPVRLLQEDDKGDPANAVRLIEYMARQRGVGVMLAPCDPGVLVDAVEAARGYGVVSIVYGDAPASVADPEGKTLLVGAPAEEYFTPLLEMVSILHIQSRNLAIVYQDTEFAATVAEATRNRAVEQGFVVVLYSAYPPQAGEESLGTLALRLQASNPDVIIAIGGFRDGVELVRAMSSYGVEAKFIAMAVAPSVPEFYSELGALSQAILYPTLWELASKPYTAAEGYEWFGPSREEFYSLFREAMESLGHPVSEPGYHAAMAALAVLAVAKAAEDAGSLDPDAIYESLKNIKIMTFAGPFDLNSETGLQNEREVLVGQWINGRRFTVWPVGQAYATPVYPHPGWPG